MLGLRDNGGAEFGDRRAQPPAGAQQNEFDFAKSRQMLARRAFEQAFWNELARMGHDAKARLGRRHEAGQAAARAGDPPGNSGLLKSSQRHDARDARRGIEDQLTCPPEKKIGSPAAPAQTRLSRQTSSPRSSPGQRLQSTISSSPESNLPIKLLLSAMVNSRSTKGC